MTFTILGGIIKTEEQVVTILYLFSWNKYRIERQISAKSFTAIYAVLPCLVSKCRAADPPIKTKITTYLSISYSFFPGLTFFITYNKGLI